MTTTPLPVKTSFLKRKLFPGFTTAAVLVVIIMLLAIGLHVYNTRSIGDANAYYTAAVESMLKSWSNFFFVAAEPGGSVSVDKPPLGLWIEALFAYFLGVSGFSVSLPNIIAGIFSIPLLYSMVKKYMGELAGLVAALVMAVTPVFVATNRNNTMDGMLVFSLLLAAWAFIKATEAGKLRWLLFGAFLVGLGFNIKMMQAFLPLPAFYALYFFGSKEGWIRKALNLMIGTVLLLVVSLSWAVAVDLTPADQRPYIGSSDNNTVMGLIFGHNGISRLESTAGPGGSGPQDGQTPPAAPQTSDQGIQPGVRQGPPPEALAACANESQGASCSFSTPNGKTIDGTCITPPNSSDLACAPQGMLPQSAQMGAAGPNESGGGTPFSQETGVPGVFRFFIAPLSKQMSWLLPFALISIVLATFGSRVRLPLESDVHKALILWGGWLLTCVVFFSMVSGIFHAYYAIMLAPPLGAMVGIGFAQLWRWGTDKNWAAILLIASAGVTLAFQVFASDQYGEEPYWMIVAGILFVAGCLLMAAARRAAYVVLLCAMLVVPAYWTVMTTVSNANINLPTAYQGTGGGSGPDGTNRAGQLDQRPASIVNEELIAYLQENTQNIEYLAAVPSSQQGAPLVLATGRPVLYMGGFGGQDAVVDADDLRAMAADDELLYVLYGDERGDKQDIATFLKTSCFVIQQFSEVQVTMDGPQPASASQVQQDGQDQGTGRPAPRNQAMSLYMCH